MQTSNPCGCALCMREETWELEHGTCYRCVHSLPCQTADDTGRVCCTILDLLAEI